MTLVEKIDREPTPWFWGINGATGVLASVLAVMIGITFGINVTMLLSGVCYLLLIPTALALLAASSQVAEGPLVTATTHGPLPVSISPAAPSRSAGESGRSGRRVVG
jgi:hypothetical protein